MAEINYLGLTQEQLKVVDEYCRDNMKKLKKVCYMVWGKRGLPYMYHDDLYDDAMNVLLESVISFKSDKKAKFQTYLLGNVKRSYHDWFRDNRLRAKRSNLELDENGKIKKDENGNPIIIGDISIDTPIGNDEGDFTIGDTIADKITVEKEFFGEREEGYSKKMSNYLGRLSPLQKEVLHLISIGFKPTEILEELHINQKMYEDCYSAIHSYRNISLLF